MTTRKPARATLAPYTLTRIAASLDRTAAPSQRAMRDALRAAGLPQAPNVDALYAAWQTLYRLRDGAPRQRVIRALGYVPVTPDWSASLRKLEVGRGRVHPSLYWREPTHGTRGRTAVTLPPGTPAGRLDRARRAAVQAAVSTALRVGTNDTVAVALTADPAAVGVVQSDCIDRTVYRGQFKGWACRYRAWTVTVPADWRMRVQRRGLALVDGMLTLDAAPLEGAPAGVEIYAATWAQQGRGNECRTVRGYLARCAGITYHATAADEALDGLRRKLRAAEWAATLQRADLGDLIAGHESITVRVADARAVGACVYGIRSWCAAVGLDFDAGAAPLAAVYAGYLREPRPEARAAILHALRRVRALRRMPATGVAA